MKIGFIGLGKLGLPCALAIESKGHQVCGYDIDDKVKKILETKILPYREIGALELLKQSDLKFCSTISEVVENSEIIFVPIQTPHQEKFEGITRLPDERIDFDYTWLKQGVKDLSDAIERAGIDKVVIIISTVLPGTIRREIIPLLGKYTKLCYNPFFIAMGTCVNDFLNPEFVLFGVDDEDAAEKAKEFYRTIHDKPFVRMSIESAELTKVAYNTFITNKLTIVNTLMEICHKIPGANVDEVTDALKMATDRVVSPRYMSAGMGDGGHCHPRDCIALSWLARELNLSHDIYNDLMLAREHQTEWLADLIIEEADNAILSIIILGKAFKEQTNLTVGSPSILLKNLLEEKGHKVIMYDPHIDEKMDFFWPSVFFIGTKHEEFLTFKFPIGSVVIDPWRYIPEQDGVKLIKVGVGIQKWDTNTRGLFGVSKGLNEILK